MLRLLVTISIVVSVCGSGETGFILCTYNSISLAKCEALLHAADEAGIDIDLDCIQQGSRFECFKTVETKHNHIVVLDEHGYKTAPQFGLRPVLFARERKTETFYIAVAPKTITLVEYNDTPLLVNVKDVGALHASFAFNAMRGSSCANINPADNFTKGIRILDSREYTPNSDSDDILICAIGKYGKINEMATCNMNTGLQNAVFIAQSADQKQIQQLKEVFSNVLKHFHNENFNFFDNIIFKNTTIGFDLQPTYVNGVDEMTFNNLHCEHNEKT